MLLRILPSPAIGAALGAALVVAAAQAAAAPADRSRAPVASGSSAAVPPGKVTLPPLPFAKMPDTRAPKTPPLAPLPGDTRPAANTPGRG